MAIVQGIREKVHMPIYDCLKVEPGKQLRDAEGTSTLKFFINVQDKTKLLTNLQSASLLPHYNTFEARAMRVIVSDLPPEFPEDPKVEDERDVSGTDSSDNEQALIVSGSEVVVGSGAAAEVPIIAEFQLGLDRVMDLLREARESEDKTAQLQLDDDDVTLKNGNEDLDDDQVDQAAELGDPLEFSVRELENYIKDIDQIPEKKQPPREQIRPNDGAGTIIGKLIYNTVTTFFVGEKIMVQMPTWNFPSGTGVFGPGGKSTSHGEPTPLATFRFAEPIFIDKQQNFRVEVEVPDSDDLKEIQKIYGPMFIWVVLDGYMTRGVQ